MRKIETEYKGEIWNARKLQKYSKRKRSWCYIQLNKVISGEKNMEEVLKEKVVKKKKFVKEKLSSVQKALLNDFRAVHAGEKSVNELLTEKRISRSS